MALSASQLRQRAWVERSRVGAMAARILEVDRLFLEHGRDGVLTAEESRALRSLAARFQPATAMA